MIHTHTLPIDGTERIERVLVPRVTTGETFTVKFGFTTTGYTIVYELLTAAKLAQPTVSPIP